MATDDSNQQREVRSFLRARSPSIDRRFRPRPDRQVRLFNEIAEEGTNDVDGSSLLSSQDSTTTDDEASKASTTAAIEHFGVGDGALVYLRLRPMETPSCVYKISETRKVLITGPSSDASSTSNNKNAMEKHYSFSEIFEGEVKQKDIYEKCIADKIQTDESFTVLTYGTSGSGKTFTLIGDDKYPGIIPRALENIFKMYGMNLYPYPSLKFVKGRIVIMDDRALAAEMNFREKLLSACADIQSQHTLLQQKVRADHDFQTDENIEASVLIWISFAEIYNECVFDLLTIPTQIIRNAPPRKSLKVISNDGQVFIKGLNSVCVKSSLEALNLLRYGLQHVNYASTSINSNSSRSHCIFFVDILKYYPNGITTQTSYKFCDLAGSERLDKTGNIGSRLKEAQRINTSLMVLGRCLDAVNNNRKKNKDVVPVRESKLTMLLQSALLGKEKLTMIVNLTPTDNYYEENLNVLNFASIAKNIIFKQPVVKQNNSRYSFFLEYSKAGANDLKVRNEYVEQLLEEIRELRNDNERLQAEHVAELLRQEQNLRNELVDSFQITLSQNKKQFENRLNQELETQKRHYENRLAAIKRKYEDEIDDLREELEEEKENAKQKDNDSFSKKRRTVD